MYVFFFLRNPCYCTIRI